MQRNSITVHDSLDCHPNTGSWLANFTLRSQHFCTVLIIRMIESKLECRLLWLVVVIPRGTNPEIECGTPRGGSIITRVAISIHHSMQRGELHYSEWSYAWWPSIRFVDRSIELTTLRLIIENWRLLV